MGLGLNDLSIYLFWGNKNLPSFNITDTVTSPISITYPSLCFRIGMENILEFAYTSKLTVSRSNVDHVLAAARELDVKNLEFACLNLLKEVHYLTIFSSCM